LDPGRPAGAVARQLGIAVTTLRTWHQRYGLGPTGHTGGRHRRYTDADLTRLETMRRLTARGIPAAEAARTALATPVPSPPEPATPAPSRAEPAPPTSSGPPVAGAQGRAGGGATIAVGRAGPAARGLARAAARMDSPLMLATIAVALARDGVVDCWDQLLRPVLAGIGARHARTGRFVEVEHLLSRCVSEALAGVARPPASVPPRVLLACAAEEQHSLPIEALDAALAERGIAARLLGARVPVEALTGAIARTGPAAVVVWSHAAGTAHPDHLRRVLAGPRPPAVLAAAGPGWDGAAVPTGVDRPASLAGALALITPVLAGV
jgi:MerR family transcriptional regulator, light-induced transcriptional regulator